MVFPFWLRQVDSRSFLGWQLGQTKDEELSFRSPDLGMPPSIHVERLFLMGGLFSVAFLRWSKVWGGINLRIFLRVVDNRQSTGTSGPPIPSVTFLERRIFASV